MKNVLSLSVGPCGCLGLGIVEVEHVIIEEVALGMMERVCGDCQCVCVCVLL